MRVGTYAVITGSPGEVGFGVSNTMPILPGVFPPPGYRPPYLLTMITAPGKVYFVRAPPDKGFTVPSEMELVDNATGEEEIADLKRAVHRGDDVPWWRPLVGDSSGNW